MTLSAPVIPPAIPTGFVRKLYRMLDLEGTEAISWDTTGTCFFIRDEDVLRTEVLPRHFRGRMDSLRQQLTEHGFECGVVSDVRDPRDVDSAVENFEAYQHVSFRRGCPDELRRIVRVPLARVRRYRGRKPPPPRVAPARKVSHASSSRPSSAPARLVVQCQTPSTHHQQHQTSRKVHDSSALETILAANTADGEASIDDIQTAMLAGAARPDENPKVQETKAVQNAVDAIKTVVLRAWYMPDSHENDIFQRPRDAFETLVYQSSRAQSTSDDDRQRTIQRPSVHALRPASSEASSATPTVNEISRFVLNPLLMPDSRTLGPFHRPRHLYEKSRPIQQKTRRPHPRPSSSDAVTCENTSSSPSQEPHQSRSPFNMTRVANATGRHAASSMDSQNRSIEALKRFIVVPWEMPDANEGDLCHIPREPFRGTLHRSSAAPMHTSTLSSMRDHFTNPPSPS